MDPRQLGDLDDERYDRLTSRTASLRDIRDEVREIVSTVREDGDDGLRELTARFDDVDVTAFDVSDRARAAAGRIDGDLRDAVEAAIDRVRAFHERQVPGDWREEVDGAELGRRFRPIERVGAYVPGGSAAYPSTAVMTVVPAKVAGVEEVVVATPPAEEMNPVTLAAIHLAGADEVYGVGGAQAVAALAYGTETIDPVGKVVGPGNRWVAAAKAEVQRDVAIDFVAGPSEVLVVADASADPRLVAAELVGQAEHDPNSSVVAVTTDRDHAREVTAEIDRQVPERERRGIIRDALDNETSGVFYTGSLAAATNFAEDYAAEHLVVLTEDDEATLADIDSAGSVFLGPNSPVAAGDYASGTNHVLPTSGMAKTTGGLSVDSFLRSTTVQKFTAESLDRIAGTVVTLAEAEGLEAHAESVRKRLE
jgi:histidinol dehydrogenase